MKHLRDDSRAALLLTVTPVLAEESKFDMTKLSCKPRDTTRTI
jgi:hypothetical protein